MSMTCRERTGDTSHVEHAWRFAQSLAHKAGLNSSGVYARRTEKPSVDRRFAPDQRTDENRRKATAAGDAVRDRESGSAGDDRLTLHQISATFCSGVR